MEYQKATKVLQGGATATGYGDNFQPSGLYRSYQAYGSTSSGSGASVIKIWASNLNNPGTSDDADWVLLGTISLTLGTTRTNDGFVSIGSWEHIRSEVDSISGTGAKVTVLERC